MIICFISILPTLNWGPNINHFHWIIEKIHVYISNFSVICYVWSEKNFIKKANYVKKLACFAFNLMHGLNALDVTICLVVRDQGHQL